jgi:subtilisin family serine protease
MATITINGVTLDPLAQTVALRSAKLLSADAHDSDYLLVQTKGPLSKEQRAALEKTGAKILEFVPQDTYVCHYPGTDLKKVRALPFVSWVNTYLRGFKINPALISKPDTRSAHGLLGARAAVAGALDRKPNLVDIVLHRGAPAAKVRAKIATAAGLDTDDIEITGNKVRVTVPTRFLPKLAEIDEVRSVEQVSPKKLQNDVARGILRVGLPLADTTVLEGAGQVVAVCDTGLDKGSTTNVHPAFKGRVAKLYALGRPGKKNDPNGHGTHVAGSVLGDGDSLTLGLKVRGTAPKAKLVLQSILDSSGGLDGIPADLRMLFQKPYTTDKARVHSNSWSNITGDGEYNSECHELDDFVWNHRDMVICFAAGNEGVDSDANGLVNANSIKPPSTAKNCITIGATENHRPTMTPTYGSSFPGDFPANPISTDRMANNPEGMVAFSSRGPTLDQRIKPDVVAPGTFILSARSRDSSNDGWGASADSLYFFEGGTSMATPLVAGCAAVLREFAIKQKGIKKPSAALIKALLINGAHSLGGQYIPSEAGVIPNVNQGFGRVDVAAIVGPFGPNGQLMIQDEAGALDTGEEQKVTVSVPVGATSLKVTLVWTDPPGEGLQNDLDLIVSSARGSERHGNQSTNATAFDRTNNVEQVVWDHPSSGQTDIRVRAFRIAQFPQSYALVVRIF